MKRLTCEMCGSTDLMKENGVFICQTCGCKYSVEEAKKMMVEGTVDVSGSTVKVDTSERLKNLYTLARRAKEDGNISDAGRYYNEIRTEDPNSWEAAFYAIYYAALDIRVAQIASAANSVSNSLDSIMTLIAENVPVEEQKKAYSEVGTSTLLLGKLLIRASWDAFCDSAKGYGMNIPNSYHNTLENRRGAAINTMASVAIAIYQKFDDIYTAKSILDKAEEICKEATSYGDSYFELCSLNREFSKVIDALQQKKNEEYWAEHQAERDALEAEKKSLENQIEAIKAETRRKAAEKKKEIETLPVLTEIANLDERIRTLTAHRDSLGFFKGKEKKATQEQIDQVSSEKRNAQGRYERSKREIENSIKALDSEENKSIAPLQNRIDAINEELTRNR